jgi:GNAT superfamily N-acetyltransferase
MPEPLVRPPTLADREPLLALMDAYIVGFYRASRPPRERIEALVDLLADGREGRQLVAEGDAGRLLGFATLYFTWSTLRADRIAVLNDLYVDAAARGTGAAAALFRGAHALARERGCAEMEWQTAADNHRAQAFYAKMGGERGDWVSYSIEGAAGAGSISIRPRRVS